MSYVQIEIGGKLRGLKFTQLAMQEFSLNYHRHTNIAKVSIEVFFIYNIFYSGLVGNYYVKGEDPDFTFFDVMEWVDDLYEEGKDEVRESVINVFKNTRIFKDAAQAITGETKPPEEKKSKVRKKSKSTGMTV